MLNMGAISEVKNFLKLRISKNKSISKAIGIAEIKDFIQTCNQEKQLCSISSILTQRD